MKVQAQDILKAFDSLPEVEWVQVSEAIVKRTQFPLTFRRLRMRS